MKLKFDNSDTVISPNENDIVDSISKLTENKISFFILEKSQKEFLQCTNSKNGKLIEYHNNKKDKHLRFYSKESSQELIIQNIISFLTNKEVDERTIDWEVFSIKERKSIINYVSRTFFFFAMILLIIFIWEYKFNDNSSHLIVGINSIDFMTIMFVFLAIGFISDFYKWDKLRIDEKAYAISSVVLAIFLVIMSILSSLGYGNFAK